VKDKVEAGMVQNHKHCQVCTEYQRITLDRRYFRDRAEPADGEHQIGPKLHEHLNEEDLATTVDDFTLPPGRMHTVDNTCWAGGKILTLGLFGSSVEHRVLNHREMRVASYDSMLGLREVGSSVVNSVGFVDAVQGPVVGTMSVRLDDGSNGGMLEFAAWIVVGTRVGPFELVKNTQAMPKPVRSATREESVVASKSAGPTFGKFVTWCTGKTGKFCRMFLLHKDKMWKRLFGFGAFVLALCVAQEEHVACDAARLNQVQEFCVVLYDLIIRLYDSAPGEVLPAIRVLMAQAESLWLGNAVASGVYLLQEAVHQFFHFAEIIAFFGGLAPYAEDFSEKYNKVFKSDVTFHSTHRAGSNQEQFLREPLVREQRQRIYRLMKAKQSGDLESIESQFTLIATAKAPAKTHQVLFSHTVKRFQSEFGIDATAAVQQLLHPELWTHQEMELGVIDQLGIEAIGREKFRSFSKQPLDSLSILALAPATPGYLEFENERDICEDEDCIPCLGVELGKTLKRNALEVSSDLLFLAVAFRVYRGEGEVLGFYVDVNEDQRQFGIRRVDGSHYGGLGEFATRHTVLEIVLASRVRGASHFVLPVKSQNRAKYLDVFRGKPGV
jgi:hypothetical protein